MQFENGYLDQETWTKTDLYNGFADFLAKKWKSDFNHSYCITSHGSWSMWRKLGLEFGYKNAQSEWHCSSLRQAADHYSWSGEDAVAEFKLLSSHLQAAVKARNQLAAHYVSRAIFLWGGVGRKSNDSSIVWLARQLELDTLTENLNAAGQLLLDKDAILDRFDGRDLLMNSAMTKVYAALAPSQLIIYDGRVGAALGLLAKDYLRSIGHVGAVPERLAFPWGKDQSSGQRNKRDPSDSQFHFPKLFGGSKDRLHAEMMRDTSRLLNIVDKQISNGSTTNLSRLERALFMIGYDVSRSASTKRS